MRRLLEVLVVYVGLWLIAQDLRDSARATSIKPGFYGEGNGPAA